MTHKVVDANNLPQITESQEAAVHRAFDEYGQERNLRAPKRFNLGGERREGVSCDHQWVAPDLAPEGAVKALQDLFEEREVKSATLCVRCGAAALWDDGPDYLGEPRRMIWAYDSTDAFKLAPKKEQPKFARRSKPQDKRRK